MNHRYRTHLRETTLLAIPVSIGQLGHVMLGVTDSVMVGRLGEIPLAAASLGHGVFVLLLVFAIGMCSALTPLTAIADGGDDHERAAVTFRHALLLNLVVGALLVVAAWLVADVLSLLEQPPAVVALTGPYLRIMGFSFIPMTLFLTVRNFIEGLSFTKPAMVAILLGNVVNIFGNWVLIYGNLGMPALGLQGAGYSSLAVEVFASLALTAYVLRARSFRRYHPLLQFPTLDRAVISRLFRIGFPSGMQYVFEAGSFTFSAVMIGWLGATALAAHQIALNLASVSFMITLGIAHAATIRVGNAVGRGDLREVRTAGFSAVAMGLLLMGCAAICFIALRGILPALYIEDNAVQNLAGQLLVLAAIFQLSDGAQVVGHGILRGMTDVTVPMLIALGAYWCLGVPASYVFAFVADLGAPGVWMGFVLGLSTAAAAFLLRFHRRSRTEQS